MTILATPPAPAIHYIQEQASYTLIYSWAISTNSGLGFGTTNRFGIRDPGLVEEAFGLTPWILCQVPVPVSISTEVEQLRDAISEEIGLSRQEIARVIGVDRRSLSGWVSGEIRPTETRMEALRSLADAASWCAARFGERARELFRPSSGGSDLLSQIAKGRTDFKSEIRAAAQTGLTGVASIATRSREASRPLYLAAVAMWADEGRLPERRGTPRDASVYTQDLSEAVDGVPSANRIRRRDI